MTNRRKWLAAFIGSFAAAVLMSASGYAEPVNFRSGETIRIIVGSSPGGGHDTMARILARHLPKHIEQNVTTRVENRHAGGGVEGLRYIHDLRTPRDGTVVMTAHRRFLLRHVMGEEQPYFNPRKQAIGSIRQRTIPTPLWVRQDVATSMEEARALKRPLIIAGSEPGSSTSFGPMVLHMEGALDFKFVWGYAGHAEAMAALERGEVEVNPHGALPAVFPRLCEKKLVFPIAKWGGRDTRILDQEEYQWCWKTLGLTEEPPHVLEVIRDVVGSPSPLAPVVLTAVSDVVEMARGSYYVPQDTPADIRQWWIGTLKKVATDPAWIKDVKAAGFAPDEFGYASPKVVVEVIEEFEKLGKDAVEYARIVMGLEPLRRW